ncbi:hypothetical protein STEG23_000165, partial [Scotinomys teguina]
PPPSKPSPPHTLTFLHPLKTKNPKGRSYTLFPSVSSEAGALPRLCDVLRVLQEERAQCLQELSTEKTGDLGPETVSGCEGLWDNTSCWPASAPAQTVEVQCPKFLQMLTGRN